MFDTAIYFDFKTDKYRSNGTLDQGINLLSRPKGFLSAITRNVISEEHILNELYFETDIIIIQRDRSRAIRGIALLKYQELKQNIVLLIIGNAKPPNVKLRSNYKYKKGKHLILFIKYFARQLNCSISLYSLDNTIPFYYNLGWRFNPSNERNYYRECVTKLTLFLKDYGYNDPTDNNNLKLKHKLLQPFFKFTKFSKELLYDFDYHDCQADKLKWAREQAKIDGYRMVLY